MIRDSARRKQNVADTPNIWGSIKKYFAKYKLYSKLDEVNDKPGLYTRQWNRINMSNSDAQNITKESER